MSAPTVSVTRENAEDFLYQEAMLLDEWHLDAWLSLFQEGGTFEVPTTDYKGWDRTGGGFFVLDDWDLLNARVKRLKSRKAHAENPHSRTHRMVTNVRLIDGSNGPEIKANFIINRFRDLTHHVYVGRYHHDVVLNDEGELKFVHRRAYLEHEMLEPGARLSFIL
ncbi:aromatic-ring-hydroxylating dioxygenase subunit beta [Cryptosporangium sp. NPDC051539]|uniref:aromatic-ring-hydroxylating dioxygenase subunit beta n=1 Tax=Cryptosporangium sp. NPDC051539 TaxID=3363962 RepID=UPI0037B65F9F